MQIATLHEGRPWICSVYFVEINGVFYWLSEPHRRHSQDITRHPQIAATIVIKQDMPVVGVQMQGAAHTVTEAEVVRCVLALYVNKYRVGAQFYGNFIAGKNKHTLYSFTPELTMIFDEARYNGESHPVTLS
jgi:uncharacterized protein YhbP (UPF0306 family)